MIRFAMTHRSEWIPAVLVVVATSAALCVNAEVVDLPTDGVGKVRLVDGAALELEWTGDRAAVLALETGAVRPRSLASGDLDEDGVPDLVVGFEWVGGGLVVVQPGNVGVIWKDAGPGRADPTDTSDVPPFLGPAWAFILPDPADLVVTGDVNADGNVDVVAAQRGATRLQIAYGDGRGSFREIDTREVGGGVTALEAMDVNRRDGLPELLVGVTDPPRLVVLEGPSGAATAEPEVLAMPGEVTSIAVGHLDDSWYRDIAVGTGSQVVVVYGRDRWLLRAASYRPEAPPAEVRHFTLPSIVRAVTVATVTSPQGHVVALCADGTIHAVDPRTNAIVDLCAVDDRYGKGATLRRARTAGHHRDDLLITDGSGQLALLEGDDRRTSSRFDVRGAVIATLPMRLSPDGLDDWVLLVDEPPSIAVVRTESRSAFTVNAVAPDGSSATCDDYTDGEPGDGLCDTGNADDGFTGICSLRAAVMEANALGGSTTITFDLGHGAEVKCGTPLVMVPATIDGAGPEPGPGVVLWSGISLREPSSVARRLVGALSAVDTGSVYSILEGNYSGTTISGTALAPSSHGAGLIGWGNRITIGGTTTQARNVVGRGGIGVGGVLGQGPGLESKVEGNYVGIDVTGTVALDVENGIMVGNNSSLGSVSNTIGGSTSSNRNVVAGTWGVGINLLGHSHTTGDSGLHLVQGNYIGTDAAGTSMIRLDREGIEVNCVSNTIGGVSADMGNVVSGSWWSGIHILGDGIGTAVVGNLIGTDATGTASLGNGTAGIIVGADSVTIGGAEVGAGNVISGQDEDLMGTQAGIELASTWTVGTVVQGNLLGTDITGTVAIPNKYGVFIYESNNNTIGGVGPSEGNLISGNHYDGIDLRGADSVGNLIQGNQIGTALGGLDPLPNGGYGIAVYSDASGNTIGGADDVDAANTIAFNLRNGIRIDDSAGSGNAVLGNSIHDNSLLGIDIGPPGVTANDPDDGDSGANDLQNFPVITNVTYGPASTTIFGELDSEPSESYIVEVFSVPECDYYFHGEAELFLGRAQTSTNAMGDATFVVDLPFAVSRDEALTATATDANGSTSELSACWTAPSGVDVAVVKSGPPSADAGDTLVYDIVISNAGDVAAADITFEDIVPGCLTGVTCAISDGSCSTAGNTVTASVDQLAPGAAVSITITATVSLSCTEVIVNTATIQAPGDINETNDSDTAETIFTLVFADGFEDGDTGQWSSTWP